MEKNKKLVSRRDFLAASGAVIAAGALSACTPKTSTVTTTAAPITTTKTVTSTATQTAPAVTTTVTGTTVTKTPETVSFDVMNPAGAIAPVPFTGLSNPRLTTLEGKKIVLTENGKPGSGFFLDELAILLKKKYPTITTFRLRGTEASTKIKDEADAWVHATGD
jgi:hypothetical protein